MKQILLVLVSGLVSTFNSQTLTQSFNEPIVGDVDKSYRLDTSSYTNGLQLNKSGNACVWDFTGLAGTFPMVVDSFIAPSAAPGASAYAGATFVQHRDLLYTFYRSTATPQQTELLGAYSPSLSLTFTNSAIIAGYPVSLGYNLSDPVSGGFKYNTTTGACNGNITISAAGSGTVQLPNGLSISNVLCLKSVEILTLSVGLFPFGTFQQTIYNYYMPGRKFPIVNINYTTYQLIAGTPTTTAFIYGSNDYYTVVGVNEFSPPESDLQLYPNPFHDQLFERAGISEQQNEYVFYNSAGLPLLITKTLSDGKIVELPPGLYFLETRNNKGSTRQKLLKE